MRSFFKLVFALVTSFFIIIFIIGFFLAYLINKETKPKEQENIVSGRRILEITLDKPIYESEVENPMGLSSFTSEKTIFLDEAIQKIRSAAKDKNYLGISLKVDATNLDISRLEILRDELEKFKKSGKFIYAYQKNTMQNAYYLNTVADSIFLHPLGHIDWKGLSSEIVFFKDLAEKIGVGFEVIKHGSHKGAVEPFTRNDLSGENKSQIQTLLFDVWNYWLEDVSKSRKIEKSKLNGFATQLMGSNPDLALQNKLVDKICTENEYNDFLRKKISIAANEKLPIENLSESEDIGLNISSKNRIAILYADGQISKGSDFTGIQSDVYKETIQSLAEDKSVKAVVLRINSPGGSADAADEIYEELLKLKKSKPLYVSVSSIAASGGYYMAAAADSIYASPNSILGSIGVFGIIPNVGELAKRNGLTTDVVSTNANSLTYSPMHGLNPVAKERFAQGIDRVYSRFLSIVSKSRKIGVTELDSLANGKIFSGSRSLEYGLIDGYASLEEVVNKIAKNNQIKDYSIEKYPKVDNDFVSVLEREFSSSISQKLISILPLGLSNYLEPINNTKDENLYQIQMFSPFKVIF